MPPATEMSESLLIAEAQLVLAAKRTSLATLRTGIALFALPLTIVSALIATSRLYDSTQVLHFLVPLLSACAFLAVTATYLMIRAVRRIRHYDATLEKLRSANSRLTEILD